MTLQRIRTVYWPPACFTDSSIAFSVAKHAQEHGADLPQDPMRRALPSTRGPMTREFLDTMGEQVERGWAYRIDVSGG